MTQKKNWIFLSQSSKPIDEPEEPVEPEEPEEPVEPEDPNKPAEPEDLNKLAEPVEPQSNELLDDTVAVGVVDVLEVGCCC